MRRRKSKTKKVVRRPKSYKKVNYNTSEMRNATTEVKKKKV